MNPFPNFVEQFERSYREARHYPLGAFSPLPRPAVAPDAPKALIFSPHPDDEVIIGGLALRLMRECGMNVLNVAVTQGSNPARQAGRWEELKNCCQHIGFGLLQTAPNGLTGVNPKTRQENPAVWRTLVDRIAGILREQQPSVILFPHDDDWNSTHIGTHHLVMDALNQLGKSLESILVETEFWGAMKSPNLMLELSAGDLGDLISALTFHVGEIQRNPYHLRLPAWMIDNVRRGCELVGGQGGAAPDFTFATLYRLRRWTQGRVEPLYEGGRFVGISDDLSWLTS